MAKMVMVGFTGMRRLVTERFLDSVFKADSIENVETLEEFFASPRGENIDWIVYSIFCLGIEIEEHLARLLELHPESRHACYSEFPVSASVALRCKKSGASYLLCNLNTQTELERLCASVALGRPWYPEHICALGQRAERDILVRSNGLSARQHTVLRCHFLGKTRKETGGELGITEKTVSTHRARCNEKMKTESQAGLFAAAVMMNLVSPFEVIRSLETEEIRNSRVIELPAKMGPFRILPFTMLPKFIQFFPQGSAHPGGNASPPPVTLLRPSLPSCPTVRSPTKRRAQRQSRQRCQPPSRQ